MDEARTGLITEHVCELIGEGRSPLVLTERRRNLEDLVGELTERVPGLFVFHGGMSAARSRKEVDRLNELPSSEPCLVLATGRYIGEGFDAPRLDTLLLAMPIAWKGTLTQYAGRLHRAHAGKREVRVYDYVDAEVPVLRRMYAKRMSAYRSLGYELSPQAALL